MEIIIDIDRELARSGARYALTAALLAWSASDLNCEILTLATFYPVPSGVYELLSTTEDAVLARDSGGVAIGGTSTGNAKLTVMGGNFGIGTINPATALHVEGGANIDELAGLLQVASIADVESACDLNGRLAQDGKGLLLTCQSGVWRKALSEGFSDMGKYVFTIDDQWYAYRSKGFGVYREGSVPGKGTFSGTMTCDPGQYLPTCGTGRTIWCGNDPQCASPSSGDGVKWVKNLPVAEVRRL